jgi:hypothetical protein
VRPLFTAFGKAERERPALRESTTPVLHPDSFFLFFCGHIGRLAAIKGAPFYSYVYAYKFIDTSFCGVLVVAGGL